MGRHIHVEFPRNRVFPPLLESATWQLSSHTHARIVRVAPKSSFAAHTGMVVKVLRGETNEVPTPLAPCKACRSCICPDYVPSIIAGAEGAILLVCWNPSDIKATSEVGVAVEPIQFEMSAESNVEESFSIYVVEGETYVGEVMFQRVPEPRASALKTYDDPKKDLFGEVAVAIEGTVFVEWQKTGEEAKRTLKVPAGYEYGPFYAVDSEGHLERRPNGALVYAPHQYQLQGAALWATVRLPVVKSDVAGPHRHCYT